MGELYFKAELLDDVVLSQKTATVGDHKSLDYIPGSVFLGIAASRFYSSIGKENAWTVFHTSKVRFCNAYPLVDGKRSLPMPLSLHSEKVPRTGKENTVLNFANCASDIKEEGIQYRQNRSGYVCISDGAKIRIKNPSKTSRMRTAIDAKTGTAAKTQLYGYESLDAGQIFIGKIEWDDSVTDVIPQIASLFETGEIVHAGRSKTASYGCVKISKYNASFEKTEVSLPVTTSFSILAVSDICMRNPATGTPELNVSPSSLGLSDEWELDRSKSFARPSYLCQYNAHRREIEMQKTLISKGSVFTFKSKSNRNLNTEEKECIKFAVTQGIGESKGQGFGEIALFDIGKEFTKEDFVEGVTDIEPELTSDEKAWLDWLKPVFVSENVEKKVKAALKEFVELCRKIKIFHSFGDDDVFWPGNAQWGRILEVARECRTKDDLNNRLSTVIKPLTESKTERNGDTKVSNPDEEWNYESYSKGKTLRGWLFDFIKDTSLNDKDVKIALQELVKRCKDKIAEKNWLNGDEK